jgi:alpha-1,2-mannosyltransferase
VAAGTAAALTALAAAVDRRDSWRYWTSAVWDTRRIGDPGFVWNQSLRGALLRAAHSATGGTALWIACAAVVGVGGLALAARLHASGEEVLAIGVAALTGLLVSPISWDHHWVWIVPLGIALVARWRAAAVWVGVWVVGFVGWWAYEGPGHLGDYRLDLWQQVPADSYVLAGLFLMVVLSGRVAWEAAAAGRPSRWR